MCHIINITVQEFIAVFDPSFKVDEILSSTKRKNKRRLSNKKKRDNFDGCDDDSDYIVQSLTKLKEIIKMIRSSPQRMGEFSNYCKGNNKKI